jgi:hypothetical protein
MINIVRNLSLIFSDSWAGCKKDVVIYNMISKHSYRAYFHPNKQINKKLIAKFVN